MPNYHFRVQHNFIQLVINHGESEHIFRGPRCFETCNTFLDSYWKEHVQSVHARPVSKPPVVQSRNGSRSKLTPDQVRNIRVRLRTGGPGIGTRLAKEYGVTQYTISMIKQNKIWRGVGDG